MKHLIDKDAVVAEIEKLKFNLCPDFYEYNYDAAKVELLEKIENFINTLEVKEVDLEEKACDAYCKVCGHYAHTTPNHICRQACDYYKNFKKYIKGE